MSKALKKPFRIKFKFEPGEKWHGYATVYPTHKGMLQALKRRGVRSNPSTAGLCCNYRKVLNFKKGCKGKDTGQICDIFLNQQDLCVEVITHEVAHACMGWANRVLFNWKDSHKHGKKKGVSWVDNDGERWAYAVGRVNEQIFLAYQKKMGIVK